MARGSRAGLRVEAGFDPCLPVRALVAVGVSHGGDVFVGDWREGSARVGDFDGGVARVDAGETDVNDV